MKPDPLVTAAERRTSNKLLANLDNVSHPLHTVVSNQRRLFSNRMLLGKSNTDRLKSSAPHSEEHRGRGGAPGLAHNIT